MQIADATSVDIQLQQEARPRQWPVTRGRCASAIYMSRVIVEGELGTWHERDAIDPALPDIPCNRETRSAEARRTSNHRAPHGT
jgi:hypothetical protein